MKRILNNSRLIRWGRGGRPISELLHACADPSKLSDIERTLLASINFPNNAHKIMTHLSYYGRVPNFRWRNSLVTYNFIPVLRSFVNTLYKLLQVRRALVPSAR